MSITFKAFTALIAEGKQAYSSESQWKTAAEEAGYVVKKLSGDSSAGDQTWGAFDDDKKVGEFGEADGSGWLSERIDELFGIFRNNEKKETPREKLKRETAEKVEKHRADQAKRNGQGRGDDVDPNAKAKSSEDDEEEDDRRKKTTSQTRSASTRGTRTTQSAAQGRAAERDWTKNA